MTGPGPAPFVVVAHWRSTFEMSAPVLAELRRRGVPAEVVVVPEADEEGGYLLAACEALHAELTAEGWAPLPIVAPELEVDRLRALNPSALVLPSPYDFHRHPSLAIERLGLPLHDIGYFHRIVPDTVGGGETIASYYDACEVVYCGSTAEFEQFLDAGLDPRVPVLTGHPGLDRWDRDWDLAPEPTVIWAPWHIRTMLTGERGYCTFLEAREAMLEQMRARPHMRFIVRPHPLMWIDISEEWAPEDEAAFRVELAALPNVTLSDANVTSPEEEIGRAWAMVTDGLSFIVDFAYTGRPLLVTEAPGHPGWTPLGEAILNEVDTALVEDGVPGLSAFLDRVEAGPDPARVARQRTAVAELLHRPVGGSAAAIADHIVDCRTVELERRARPVVAAPMTTEESAALAALSQPEGRARVYQRHLLEHGTLPWGGREVRAETLRVPHVLTGLVLLLDDGAGTVLLTGPQWEGWALTGLVRGERVYDAQGAERGGLDDVLGAALARRIRTASLLGGPRTLLLGTGSVWTDIWSQLPAVVEAQDTIASLAAAGEVRVLESLARRGQLDALGGVGSLLPKLAPLTSPWPRQWSPAALVPLAGARASTEVRALVAAALAGEVPRQAPGPVLWVGLSGEPSDPRNAPEAVAEVALAWQHAGGGDVRIDAFAPDDLQRGHFWERERIERSARLLEECARAGEAVGARLDVVVSQGLRASLQRVLTADVALACSGWPVQAAAWLAAVPTLVVLGPSGHPDSVLAWWVSLTEDPPPMERVDSALVVPGDDGFTLAAGAGGHLAARLRVLADQAVSGSRGA